MSELTRADMVYLREQSDLSEPEVAVMARRIIAHIEAADEAMREAVENASEAYRASDGEMEIDGHYFEVLRAARLPEGE